MKNLNQNEVEIISDWLADHIQGSQIQSVVNFEKGLGLELYKKKTSWLIFDLSNTGPFVFLFDQPPWNKSRKTKPIGLFINAHAKNLEVKSVQVLQEYGRVLQFDFISRSVDDPRSCQLEFHLIPKRVNLMARTSDKSISYNKPMPLEPMSALEQEAQYDVRSLKTIEEEWSITQKSVTLRKPQGYQIQSSAPGDALKKQWQKDLSKKEKAMAEIETQIEEQENLSKKLYEAGQSLKWKSLDEVLSENPDLKDLKKTESLSVNMEKVFQKAKSLIKKNDGALKRIESLKKEILHLRQRIESDLDETAAVQKMDEDKALLSIPSEIQARKKNLDLHLVAYKGKSAKDNLALLRAAKPWDYWFHLKDYPGAYAILRRNKNQSVQRDQIQQLATWMVEDLVNKKSSMKGVAVNVVYAECRYVRPIRGDRLGRVQYQSEKTLRIKID